MASMFGDTSRDVPSDAERSIMSETGNRMSNDNGRMGRRFTALGLGVTLSCGAVMAFALPASAAADHCSAAQPWVFTQACIGSDPNGYDAGVEVGSNPGTWDLHLVCDNGHWFGDDGSFYADTDTFHTYVFAVGSQGTCHVEAIDLSDNSAVYDSPNFSR